MLCCTCLRWGPPWHNPLPRAGAPWDASCQSCTTAPSAHLSFGPAAVLRPDGNCRVSLLQGHCALHGPGTAHLLLSPKFVGWAGWTFVSRCRLGLVAEPPASEMLHICAKPVT